jgi:hypothetical protein
MAPKAETPRFLLFRHADNLWCAAPPDFKDIRQDPAGWGETREMAIQKLLADAKFRRRARRRGWPTPSVSDFVEKPEPVFLRDLIRATLAIALAYARQRAQRELRLRREPGKRASHARYLPRSSRTGRRHFIAAQTVDR